MNSSAKPRYKDRAEREQQQAQSAGAKGAISPEQALALLVVVDGCDVYSPYLARVLRGIEQQFPHLVDITSPRMPKRGKWDTAYFGAVATPAGRNRALALAEWGADPGDEPVIRP